ncbi:MAG TPA: ABC transporter substrate-binding protein [Caulobacteraceae bacterium]|jgi:phospholipid transport system substrate-binding protein
MVSRSVTMKAVLAGAAALALAFGAVPAGAASDPAASTIESLDAHTLAIMKEGQGFRGRYAKLKPVLEQALDLPAMTRFAVGPTWASMSEAQHQALITAFTRMTVSLYAHNFAGYDGQKFEVGAVQTRGPDKLVLTKIIPANGKAVDLTYRMRQSGSTWKVIDVFYQGTISDLTTRRSDFAATLAKGGEPALVEHLNALSDKLAK